MMNRMTTASCSALVLCAAAAIHGSAQTALPRVVPVFTSSTIDASPQALFSPIAVGPQGSILFNAERGADVHLVLVDSTGKVLRRFVRDGEGPGEGRNPFPLEVGRETATAWDAGLLRLSEWSFDGTLRRATTPHATGAFVARFGDGFIGMLISEAGITPVVLDPKTSTTRDLLAPTDSFFHAEFKPLTPANPVSAAPAFGEWAGGFIVANPSTYHIGLYDRKGTLRRVLGRSLPPALPTAARLDRQIAQVRTLKIGGRTRTEAELQTIRDRSARTPLPAFALAAPLRTDAKARIWVVGIEGDSAFADLFTAERFLGRIGLSCPGFEGKWSLAGSWLAAVCAPRDASYDGDAVVRLFRIAN